MSASDSIARAAAFVRGFFLHLEAQGITNAVLHGGEGGFERALSDVDFVVARGSFESLPSLIDSYCDSCGWWLCQILRHETTAAYFVCSAADDPACAVALDACSDYQRNGTVYLTAEELLENTLALDWGGFGLSAENELRYRFAKAAAKNKDAAAAAAAFARYPEQARQTCETWLAERWAIVPSDWYACGFATALQQLRRHSRPCPTLFQAGSLARILARILHPTGLVVITGGGDFDATAAMLEKTFGHLHFRRFRKTDRWHPTMLKELISSTLIVIPSLQSPWQFLLPTACIHSLSPGEDSKTRAKALAKHMHERCTRRERQAPW